LIVLKSCLRKPDCPCTLWEKEPTIIIIVAIAVVVLFTALLIFAGTKPDTFRVERTKSVKTSPAKILSLIDDFHKWGDWSPWEKLEPAMKRTYSGADRGKGSGYAWEDNNRIGKGRMEIIDISPPSRVIIKLDFEKPMEGHNVADFTLEGKGDSTMVRRAMYSPNPHLAKGISIFFGMDKMIGKDFETGLIHLKAVAEK